VSRITPKPGPQGDAAAPERVGLPLTALTGMMLAASLAPLGSTMIAIALPGIGRDIGAEVSDLTPWLVSSYLIASIALQSPGGKLGDLIGHGRAIVAGLSIVALGSVIGSFGSDAHVLGAARILMASGGAATVPATMAILRNQTAPARRARIFGLFGACMGLAAAIGPLVAGELTQQFGWRAVFAANLPVVAVALLLVMMSRRTFARAAGERPSFDWPGSALLASGLTLTIVALQMSGGTLAWSLGGLGVVLLAVFPFWERRAASPVVDFSLLRRGAFFGGASIIGLQNMAMYPLLFQLPVFFDRVRSLGARPMGQALLALTLAMMVSSVVGGRLAERIGARTQTLVGSLVALAGLYWFADFESVHAPSDVMPGMLLMGAGVGMTSPPAQAASMSTVGRDQSGMAGGIVSTMRYIGGVAGATVLSALLRDASSPASHQRPLIIYAGALVVAAGLSLLLPGRISLSRSAERGSA
jgi:MFS family permease